MVSAVAGARPEGGLDFGGYPRVQCCGGSAGVERERGVPVCGEGMPVTASANSS
jgi:hypothetical protein